MKPVLLRDLPKSGKVLVTLFMMAIAVGYGVSVMQVFNRTGLDYEKTVKHFRGSDLPEEEALYVPQSNATLISVAHVHSFSQPMVIGIVSLLFLLTGLSEASKIFWIAVSFIGSLSGIAGPWLIRDVSSRFALLLSVSGGAMLLGFVVMAGAILKETWRKTNV